MIDQAFGTNIATLVETELVKNAQTSVVNARLTFDYVVGDRLQDMIETNFEFYKRVTDDRDFARFFIDWLFDRYLKKTKREKN